MTRTTTPNSLYNPTTDRGTGISLPISKAVYHAMSIFTATQRNWPMTNEEAHHELTEALNHIGDIQDINNLISTEASEAITNWTDTLPALQTQFPDGNTDPIDPSNIPAIRTMVTEAWGLLSLIDRELTGLTGAQSDPGRLP